MVSKRLRERDGEVCVNGINGYETMHERAEDKKMIYPELIRRSMVEVTRVGSILRPC
jgi:hypothetical protein